MREESCAELNSRSGPLACAAGMMANFCGWDVIDFLSLSLSFEKTFWRLNGGGENIPHH